MNEINETNILKSEAFILSEAGKVKSWMENGGEGSPPSKIDEIKNLVYFDEGFKIKEFTFIPKIEEPEHVDTQEEIDAKRINELKGVLSSTDWYIIRQSDITSGKEVPQDILDKRQEARDELAILTVLEQ